MQEAIKHADTEVKAKQDKVSGAAVLTMVYKWWPTGHQQSTCDTARLLIQGSLIYTLQDPPP